MWLAPTRPFCRDKSIEYKEIVFNDNMTYRLPGPLPLESATPARIAVLMLHDIAINRLLWLTNFVHTCTAGALSKRLALRLKMRNRHLWDRGETNAYAAQKKQI